MQQMLFLASSKINRIVYPLLENVVRPSFRSPKKLAEVQDILKGLVLVPSVNINVNVLYEFPECLAFSGVVLGRKLSYPKSETDANLIVLSALYGFQALSYTAAGYFTYLLLKERKLVTSKVRTKFLTSTDGRLSGLMNSVYADIDQALIPPTKKLFSLINTRLQSRIPNIPTITTQTLNNTEATARLLYSVLR